MSSPTRLAFGFLLCVIHYDVVLSTAQPCPANGGRATQGRRQEHGSSKIQQQQKPAAAVEKGWSSRRREQQHPAGDARAATATKASCSSESQLHQQELAAARASSSSIQQQLAAACVALSCGALPPSWGHAGVILCLVEHQLFSGIGNIAIAMWIA